MSEGANLAGKKAMFKWGDEYGFGKGSGVVACFNMKKKSLFDCVHDE